MTIVDDSIHSPAPPVSEQPRVPAFGRFTPVITTLALFALAVVTWWLIGYPDWSVLGAKANGPADEASKLAIVGCLLFWTIFGHIFTGFTFGNWPFSKLRHPLSGIAQILVNLTIGVIGTLLFTRGVGAWDPTFSASAAGGAGYTATAFIVLIGFYAYAFLAASLGGYPFEAAPSPTSSAAHEPVPVTDLRNRQPAAALGAGAGGFKVHPLVWKECALKPAAVIEAGDVERFARLQVAEMAADAAEVEPPARGWWTSRMS